MMWTTYYALRFTLILWKRRELMWFWFWISGPHHGALRISGALLRGKKRNYLFYVMVRRKLRGTDMDGKIGQLLTNLFKFPPATLPLPLYFFPPFHLLPRATPNSPFSIPTVYSTSPSLLLPPFHLLLLLSFFHYSIVHARATVKFWRCWQFSCYSRVGTQAS